jgi:16S rRNA (cytosine967-C5)-methyltransferase
MRERWRGRASDSHLQAGQVACVALDGTASLPFSGEFARILVDAPCSGTGTLARNPEIRWRLRLEDLPELAARQRALLERAAERLAAGGTLVYSTCSLEPEENEQVVEWFLGRHPKFELKSGWEALEPHLRGGLAVAPNDNESQILDCRFQKGVEQSSAKTEAALFEVHGFFQTLPHRHGTDGFFAAVLVKNP